MKILMINKFFYRKGGSEAYMFDLIDLLKKSGHEVVEFSMSDKNNQDSKCKDFFIDNIDFSKREGFFKDLFKAGHLLYSFEARKKLQELINKEKPDIAHLHNFSFQLTPSILAVLKKNNIPIIWTMHDYKLICPNYRLFTKGAVCERCKKYKYYNCFRYKCIKNETAMSFLAMLEMYLHKILLRSYESINLFISPSKFLAEKVVDWGIDAKKVKHIYNFINLENFLANAEIGHGLIYFGRLSEEKGLLTLLEAMKELPEINLTIIGDGPQKFEIENRIKEQRLSNVRLLGYKKGQELYNLIKQSRLVVMPSIWYENNPIAILEAFAMGKPVIGADLGGIPELVRDGQTGFIFKNKQNADLIEKIKNNYFNTELIQQMSQNCRQFVVENGQGSVHLKQIEAVYKTLIK
ncbi:glycosyltransferase family 4 protein [Candidatus Falkowbacteria bacterium]|nr:glycosyltransferase family 4 protein [Candidatus Falkowbacteria bacterium]